MNKLFFTLVLSCLFLVSCSGNDINDDPLLGVWKLTEWNIADGFDIDNDGFVSTNLLNEINCSYNETLLFEPNNIVSLNTTFNPKLEIAQLNNSTNEYSFNVECDTEGVVSLATFYSKEGNSVIFGESEAVINGNQISIVFKESIEIYNEDFTQVIANKDLTVVYTKQ
ncbi:hypothetical protein [uncultured Algibacter sp.]|uniref:hypothetical protein n=1 Tax=uncultured Algibacter sp. TaxID=298659 RepID=UPI0026323124|nr:hypothetical protein [uncultured Algibacter sp.]